MTKVFIIETDDFKKYAVVDISISNAIFSASKIIGTSRIISVYEISSFLSFDAIENLSGISRDDYSSSQQGIIL